MRQRKTRIKNRLNKATLRRIFRDFIWPRRWVLLVGLVLIAISRSASLVIPGSTKYLIDDVVTAGHWENLRTILAVVAAASFVQGGASFLLTRLLSVAAQRLINELRVKVQSHVLRLPAAYFDEHRSGELVTRVMNDAEGVRNLVGTGFVQLIGGVLTASGALFFLFRLSATLTFASMGFLAVFGVLVTYAFRTLRPIFRERSRLTAEVNARLTETLSGIRIIKGFNAEEREDSRFKRGIDRIFENVRRTLTANGLISFGGTLLVGLTGVMVMGIGGLQIRSGAMSVGDLFSYTLYLGFLIAPVVQISNIGTQLTEAFAGLDRIDDILRQPRESGDALRTIPLPTLAGDFEFQNVSFAYGKNSEALRGVNLVARRGTVTALVGPSGAGKTTLTHLVACFARPTRGRILVDGKDLSHILLDDYRARLGMVMQDNFLFDGTVEENLRFARPLAPMKELRKAARVANADEFIHRLPKGYKALIGERGVKLSGGQKQRLAIARALLADPRVLILDEATSSLDTESEALIQKALKRLCRGRTVFVIAHRLSTIREADQILFIENGRVVERGRHEELFRRKGRYWKLYTMQARI